MHAHLNLNQKKIYCETDEHLNPLNYSQTTFSLRASYQAPNKNNILTEICAQIQPVLPANCEKMPGKTFSEEVNMEFRFW